MTTEANQPGTPPPSLERSEVPQYFRQFQNASVLKKLAHRGTGPLYQLIGRKAWYETADIVAWLESRKKPGPRKAGASAQFGNSSASHAVAPEARERRGRPTKAEQRKRALAERNGASRP
jgi:hypothetical protein